MKQIIQDFKTGEIKILEVADPQISDGFVIVKNHCSIISAGTERGTVVTAQKNLIGKARNRPDLVRQVISMTKKKGLKSTLDKVRSKLDSYKALGYSTSGEIIDVGNRVTGFKIGDRVSCSGSGFASHAELIKVPVNLIVKIPDNVAYDSAAFSTIGAIALQGVRRANPQVGENVAVIGMGLIGLITLQILKSMGTNVCCLDISEKALKYADTLGGDSVVNINESNLNQIIKHFTNGAGFDSIIITASTQSKQPIETAGEIARDKATVVVVGAVDMSIPRQSYYEKELDIKLSRSYGPGRYDPQYEECGIDYPYGYVRWTENRNISAFLNLLSNKNVEVSSLVTHRFPLDNANQAYDILSGKIKESYLAMMIEYPESTLNIQEVDINLKVKKTGNSLKIGFIGAGNFAGTYLLPELNNYKSEIEFVTICDNKGYAADKIKAKYHFLSSSTTPEEVMDSEMINTIFIATKHNSHFKLLSGALKQGKNVFLEKPLVISEQELIEFKIMVESTEQLPVFTIGYNRRYSKLTDEIIFELSKFNAPKLVNYRVNAGSVSDNHWVQNPEIGGGRIIGEACHFIDYIIYLIGNNPVCVFAQSINKDTFSVIITFQDGSIGNLTYLSNGGDSLNKEYVEIHTSGKTMILDDFKEVRIFSGNNSNRIKSRSGRDIGREGVISNFLRHCKSGSFPIPINTIITTSLITFLIEKSIKSNLPVKVNFKDISY